MANIPDSPITRKEKYLDAIANGTTEVPEPITREEEYLAWIALNGGGGGGGTGEVTGVKGSAESTFRKGNVSISPANIGLDKVNNTPDLNKPISNATQAALDLKVDKVEGKGLSDNNYSDDDKAIVDGVETELAKKVNKITGKGLSTNDYTNDDKAIVDGVTAALADKVDKVQGKGLSTNDYTDTDKAEVAKVADKADAEAVPDSASYDSANHLILFKNGSTTLFSLDAAAFVKDGMVDTVEITGGNLVITFNTDAGKQAISIPLTDIFDPSNYYNKTATDNLLADKTDKVSGATNGNFAGLDANGNLTDSGKSASDFATGTDIQNRIKETVGWTGKNLLVYPYNQTTRTTNGITYTDNGDGSITANGTATAEAYQVMRLRNSDDGLKLKAGKYILSGCPNGGGQSNYQLYIINTDNTLTLARDIGDGATFTLDSDITAYGVLIRVSSGITVSSLTFYPMIRYADIADDTWEPYHESVETMYEEEIHGVNLLDLKSVNAQEGITYVIDNNNRVTLSGTLSQANWLFQYSARVSSNAVKLKQGEYVFSIGVSIPHVSLQVGYTHPTTGEYTQVANSESGASELKFTSPVSDCPWTIQLVSGAVTLSSVVTYPMLRKADIEDGTYRPYNLQSIQHQLDAQGVLGAKNLLENNSVSETINGITFTLNSDGSVTAQGTPTGITRYSFTRKVNNEMDELPSELIGKSVIVSGGYTQNNGTLEISCITRNSSGQDISDHAPANGAKERQFTIESNAAYIRIYAIFDRNGNHTPVNVTMKPMLRLASDPDDTYVPYAPTNAKLNEEKMSYADNGVLGAKNLLKVVSNTQTINGVTFTVNEDGSVTANGTATANVNFRLIPYADIDLSLWTGKNLRLSGCPSGGSNPTYALEIYYRNEQEHWLRDFGDGVELSIPISGLTTINPNIMVKNGVTVNNLVFKPMLRLASDTDDTYQPYTMTNRELTERVVALPNDVFVTTDTRTTTTNDANTLPCGFTRMSDANSNLPTDGTSGGVWYDILTVRQSNNPSSELWGYGFQLAIQTTTTATQSDTYVRAVNGGATPVWGTWKKLTT